MHHLIPFSHRLYDRDHSLVETLALIILLFFVNEPFISVDNTYTGQCTIHKVATGSISVNMNELNTNSWPRTTQSLQSWLLSVWLEALCETPKLGKNGVGLSWRTLFLFFYGNRWERLRLLVWRKTEERRRIVFPPLCNSLFWYFCNAFLLH